MQQPLDETTGFSSRLKEVFEGKSVADIGRILGVPHATARNYFIGRLPATEILVKIANKTGVLLNWLLLRQHDTEYLAVMGLAKANDLSLEEMLDRVLIHGLAHYASAGALTVTETPADVFGQHELAVVKRMADADSVSTFEKIRQLVLEKLKDLGELPSEPEESNIVFFGEITEMIELPLMGEIAAGGAMEGVQSNEKVMVPDLFRPKHGKQYMVLRARGDSMINDNIANGSLIVCEVRHEASDGEIVAAMIDGQNCTVKRLFREPGRIRLQPANPLHKPIYVYPNQNLEIQGVVVGIWRPHQ